MKRKGPTLTQKEIENAVTDPGNLMLLVYTVLIGLILLGSGFLYAGEARSAESHEGQGSEFNLEEISEGKLLVPGQDGNVVSALKLSQKVIISISGVASRVTVIQEFVNNSPDWVEGVYVFPLPAESAVDHLKMVIGEREVVGEIKEKEQARKIYEKAKGEGRKTSLLAQNRPNIFTTRLANIGPGEKIVIEIEYQQTVQYRDQTFSIRFPMAMTPRYIPGKPVNREEASEIGFSEEGWAVNTDQVPDALEITPPMVVAGVERQQEFIPTVELEVDLASGFPLSRVESLYHEMYDVELAENRHMLSFTGIVFADHDFVLEWQPAKAADATAALLTERPEGDENSFMLLMLMPPENLKSAGETRHVPREAVYILDVSGSMSGPPIRQAKVALARALDKLQPKDRFNIISFNNTARKLFTDSVAANSGNITIAKEYLNTLRADGGTEMKPALEMALNVGDSAGRGDRVRQVIFMTDGAIGNESELFALINSELGRSRLFTVGIGSAPNSHFMTRAAKIGRGSYTYIGNLGEVGQRIDELFIRLENPVLTNITIEPLDEKGNSVEAVEFLSYPHPVPDLYLGEPLQVAMRMDSDWKKIRVSGTRLGERWQYVIDVSRGAGRAGIATLWARKKIADEMESLALGKDENEVRQAILETALEHHLVSKYTSLVAVDKEISRPRHEVLKKEAVPTPAPRTFQFAGNQNGDAVFAGSAKTGTASNLHLLVGFLLMLIAAGVHIIRRRIWVK
ncbi:marine proteobacterial sortase target protein [Desulfosediminicola sp.]|uniref:marine proteobacterial sortase target protein n=1 Tax=Desulfosediminicola sp. TaxID=2886825 RepID=UPI003AF28EC9